MGEGGAFFFPAVAAPAYDFAIANDNAAYGDFTCGGGFLGQKQGLFHKKVMQSRPLLSKKIWSKVFLFRNGDGHSAAQRLL